MRELTSRLGGILPRVGPARASAQTPPPPSARHALALREFAPACQSKPSGACTYQPAWPSSVSPASRTPASRYLTSPVHVLCTAPCPPGAGSESAGDVPRREDRCTRHAAGAGSMLPWGRPTPEAPPRGLHVQPNHCSINR
ncbi:hypothetical protein FA95DRAFT_1558594 [Auriscalpium vulgare]|uniref:Uncharacterized protein n=1 Tax=Auriscalpium vulgare TaxID=40419 RepID=A0ACB8RUF7_9AGAM|nr:hypothetical protein FA95DRAFT_1558594 [Auriscalpium vulgare]